MINDKYFFDHTLTREIKKLNIAANRDHFRW